jgi:hypothetical protein
MQKQLWNLHWAQYTGNNYRKPHYPGSIKLLNNMTEINASTARTASVLAGVTAIVFFLLLGAVHTNGISQQYFELVHTPEKYTEELVEHSNALNVIFVLDNIFIILYTSMTLFTVKTLSSNAPSFVAISAFVLISLVAALDFIENFHIYALMQQAKNGITVSAEAISWQSAESMLKWHLAYFAFFMLGFLAPAGNIMEKTLKYSLWFLFVPAGVLVYATVGTSYAAAFQWIRYLNLLSGFILICLIMRSAGRGKAGKVQLALGRKNV